MLDYNTEISNKPTINGVTLEGDMTLEDIGIVEMDTTMLAELVLEQLGTIL